MMLRRVVALLTACMFLFATSCTHPKLVTSDQIKTKQDHISAVVVVGGEVVEFDSEGARLDSKREWVKGTTINGEERTIALTDVVSATVERTSAGSTVGILIIGVIAIILLIAATNDDTSSSSSSSGSSCPYVYAFDGANFVLDAEPLTGAISKGLERDDLCRLDHVRADNGRFELMVRNELDETQHIDGMRLRVVDHPAGTEACTGANGAIRVVEKPVAATVARDERGVDLRRIVSEADCIPWQSVMPLDDSWQDVSLRNELTFSFVRVDKADHANLIVNASTSQWGSIMMREMLQARGSGLKTWRESIDAGGPAMQELVQFNLREEIYFLRVYVHEGDQWVARAWIPAGGPAVSETRAIPLDLGDVRGDTVEIRVQPPRGFWSFDYVAMSWGEGEITSDEEIPLERALLTGGNDVTAAVVAADGQYHEMKNIGDTMTLRFAAPRKAFTGERTIFLDTRGYYESHIDESRPEQTRLIDEVLANNGAIVRYSLQKYVELTGSLAAKR
jgi:hypothetical protein